MGECRLKLHRFQVQPSHPLPAAREVGKAAREPHLGCPLASAFIQGSMACLSRISQPSEEERPRAELHLSSAQGHSQVNIREKIKHNHNFPWQEIPREVACGA